MKLQLNENTLNVYLNEAIKQELNEELPGQTTKIRYKVDFQMMDQLVGNSRIFKTDGTFWENVIGSGENLLIRGTKELLDILKSFTSKVTGYEKIGIPGVISVDLANTLREKRKALANGTFGEVTWNISNVIPFVHGANQARKEFIETLREIGYSPAQIKKAITNSMETLQGPIWVGEFKGRFVPYKDKLQRKMLKLLLRIDDNVQNSEELELGDAGENGETKSNFEPPQMFSPDDVINKGTNWVKDIYRKGSDRLDQAIEKKNAEKQGSQPQTTPPATQQRQQQTTPPVPQQRTTQPAQGNQTRKVTRTPPTTTPNEMEIKSHSMNTNKPGTIHEIKNKGKKGMKIKLTEETLEAYINEAIRQELQELNEGNPLRALGRWALRNTGRGVKHLGRGLERLGGGRPAREVERATEKGAKRAEEAAGKAGAKGPGYFKKLFGNGEEVRAAETEMKVLNVKKEQLLQDINRKKVELEGLYQGTEEYRKCEKALSTLENKLVTVNQELIRAQARGIEAKRAARVTQYGTGAVAGGLTAVGAADALTSH